MIKTLHNFFALDRPDLSMVEAEVVVDLAFVLLLTFDSNDRATWWAADKVAAAFSSSHRPGRNSGPRRLRSRQETLGKGTAKRLSQVLGVEGYPQRFDDRRHINKAAAVELLEDVLAAISEIKQSSTHLGIVGRVISVKKSIENFELMQRVAIRHLQGLSKPFRGNRAGRPRSGLSLETPKLISGTDSVRVAARRGLSEDDLRLLSPDGVERELKKQMQRYYRAKRQ